MSTLAARWVPAAAAPEHLVPARSGSEEELRRPGCSTPPATR
ncbi:hypothetical protein [Amycolatopsis viridis]|uniref:Uncharacterized protein n=1 Tax=Amycolatopsis viridis TaxID=185678 RepID=A0ABX0T448_9PSEU|nr:hypothetical protein [Amycolatopsis viridis]NIH82340.1 hypothetical protein [Amycolatopsis viridis]